MFECTKQGAVDVIRAEAPLIGENHQSLREVFDRCGESGQPNVVLEMQDVSLIDSEGLELLLTTLDDFSGRGGVLKLAMPTPLCREILTVTGVARRFELFADVNSAVGSFVR
jgi:anti-anti-sigma factor